MTGIAGSRTSEQRGTLSRLHAPSTTARAGHADIGAVLVAFEALVFFRAPATTLVHQAAAASGVRAAFGRRAHKTAVSLETVAAGARSALIASVRYGFFARLSVTTPMAIRRNTIFAVANTLATRHLPQSYHGCRRSALALIDTQHKLLSYLWTGAGIRRGSPAIATRP